MSNSRIRQDLTNAISGYKAKFVELERIVDAEGYQPTLTSLNDASQGYELSGFWADLSSGSDLDTFTSRLSIKSKGLLLTSSLMTGNQSIYQAMYSSVQNDVNGLYSQDLYSMLGDVFAPKAIVEMTSRASRDVTELGRYNASLQTLAGSITATDPLVETKSSIVSSAWVEKYPEESRQLMSIVNDAPESVETSALKSNPLKKFLATGLAFAATTAAIGSIAIASLWGANLVQKSENIAFVDLSSRPTIETSIGSGKTQERKIVNYGEFDGTKMLEFYVQVESMKPVSQSIQSLSKTELVGKATLINKGALSDEALCVVHHKQKADVTADGNFYDFKDLDPTITDKRYADFMVKSHETGHCFFFPDINQNQETAAIDRPESTRGMYNASLLEVAADLTAIVDYMRVNGNADLYNDYLRPLRLINVDDTKHRTAMAIDIVIKQLDPIAIQKKSPQEIPEVVRVLMEKNFMAEDSTYNPGRLSQRGTAELDKPAVKALWIDVLGSSHFRDGRQSEFRDRMATEVTKAFSEHVASYQGVAPAEVIQHARVGYAKMAEKFKLGPLKEVSAPQAKLAQPTESMMKAFL